eukprot:TRINITY_DN914_c0_g1_i3.p1 TRINITY_DN914_c0_g1~~TRINITY_DN914_c0_g1_i3.p1  ORF type:complete len:277 (+),score=142.60 TRINITY_DN914_c0_g1_i3:97-831(+)
MPGKVPVPESKKKSQAAAASVAAGATAAGAKRSAKRLALRREHIKRAARYARQYKATESALKAMKRTAADTGNFLAEPEARVAFVVRIRGINDVAPKPRKILQLLRLRQIFNGVFVRMNKATVNMLRRVEPYIAYGYPSLKTVRALLYKRGHMSIKGQRIPLTNNDVVAEALQRQTKGGVICAEDVVNQLYTGGEHFSAVAHSLWPFKLSAPNGGLKYKNMHFVEGGDFGNRETLINAFVEKLL